MHDNNVRKHRQSGEPPGGIMGATTEQRQKTLPIELQSLIDSHEQPFVVIDRDFHIMATNKAYQKAYCSGDEPALGQECYKVSHHNNVPCCQLGEECPHSYLFEHSERKSCVHIHYDQNGLRPERPHAPGAGDRLPVAQQ
jgi:PAS domain-containing protein